MLRRCGVFRMMPGLWLKNLKEMEARRAASKIEHLKRSMPIGMETMKWDPEESADVAFRPGRGDVWLDTKGGSALTVCKVAMGISMAWVVAPALGLFYTGNNIVFVSDMLPHLIASTVFGALSMNINEFIVSTVVSLRIIPNSGDSPVGAVIELGIPASFYSSTTNFVTYPLSSVAFVSSSDDGNWRGIGFHVYDKTDTYTLSALPYAHQVIPFVVAMKRHLEIIDPSNPPMEHYLAIKNGTDPVGLIWNPDMSTSLPDVTINHPFPWSTDAEDSASGTEE